MFGLDCLLLCLTFFFFKQKTAYEMRISDWSSDVCSSDLLEAYPTVQQLKAQVDEVNRQIQTIATGIKQSIRQEYESARLQEGSLEAQVDRLKSATLSEQDRSVRYNILAREADTNRTLYDGLLQRSEEHTSELQSLMRISYAA